jgi:hypothetical protein
VTGKVEDGFQSMKRLFMDAAAPGTPRPAFVDLGRNFGGAAVEIGN